MSEIIAIVRILLIPAGIGIFFLAAKLARPSEKVLRSALRWCWVAGILNLLADVIQEHYGFWHYTISGLLFGFPIDLYIAVSLIIGGAVPLLCYWLRSSHPRWAIPFFLILPCYLLFQDYAVQKLANGMVFALGSPYWWISDFSALAAIVWSAVFIFNYLINA